MNKTNRYSWLLIAICLMLLAPFGAMAQETTSSIRVTTVGADGSPAAGVAVTVTDTRTGTTRSGSTGNSGAANFSGMRVGGPYTVQASSDAFGDQTVTDVFLRLGDTYLLPLSLSAGVLEEVIVTATQVQTRQLALGPASTFGLEDLQDYPAVNRDIRDIIRFDPRIYQDQGFVGAMHCGGLNPRFNSLTLDGVRMNDNFGLNSNGYPTERQPFPYDSIQQVSVELAPFDVQYGGFTACNINAVTKSGENEFFGSAFFDYYSDGLRGDKLEGRKLALGTFDEERYGVSFGGPIIKDKLFFFAAYEKLEGADLFDRGPVGSGRAVEVRGVSQAQFDEILDIIQNIYGYDPGGLPTSLPVEDEKYVVKFDWNINDNHRATLNYNYNDGFSWSEADGDANELEFSNHYYERGAELTATTAALFSDWTANFTTELRVSYSELDNRQISRDQEGFAEFRIETWNDHDGDGDFDRANVFVGRDDSRQANQLDYTTLNMKLAGAYALDNHILTFGYELVDLEIFDLFIQHTETENRFDEPCGPPPRDPNACIDDLREARPDDIYYGNAAGTNNPADAGFTMDYKINTVYFQDEITADQGRLTIVAGLRYDWYDDNVVPTENPFFVERRGFSNAVNFDGESLLQPRLGITYDLTDNLTLRGGFGLFEGGNPNVWLMNNFTGDGFTVAQLRESRVLEAPIEDGGAGYGKDFSLFDIPLGPDGNGRPGFDVPTDFIAAVENATGDLAVNALEPGFTPPSNWKYNLGLTWDFADNYQMNADLLYTQAEDSALVVCGSCEQTGTAPDGRAIYTNDRRFRSDLILSNVKGSDGKSFTASVGLNASYQNGFDWSVGYAYTEAEEVSPMTSSVAFSNFVFNAVDDFNAPSVSTANYEIPHRFTFRVSYEAYWWGNNRSKISLFGSANEGRPYSYVFAEDDGTTFGDDLDDRHLLYVPTGMSDPNVVFDEGFATSAFLDFVNSSGLSRYAGGIAPRNAFNSGWWTHFDLRLEQEFPGFGEGHNFVGYIVIRNFCNFINDDWCVLKEVDFPRRQAVVDMEIENGQYLFEEFIPASGETLVVNASLYEIRVGLRYDF